MSYEDAESQRLISEMDDEISDSMGNINYGVNGGREASESIATNITTLTNYTDQPLFEDAEKVEAGDEEEDTSGPPQAERISTFQAGVSLLKGNLGTGILAMPYAFKTSGLWFGAILISVTAAVSIYCMHQLRDCSQYLREKQGLDRGKMDYGEVAKAAFKNGPLRLQRNYRIAKYTVNGFICIVQFGFCCVYVLFMAQNLESLVSLINPNVTFPIHVWAAFVLACLLPYCVVKKLRKLSFLSYIANAMTIVGLTLILIYCWMNMKDYRKFPFANDLSSLPISLGIVLYSFETISLILPIENKMSHPEDYGGPLGLLNVSMIVLVLLFIMVGFFGYLGLGEATASSITYNIPITPWCFALVKPMFMACIFVSYGLQFYVPAYVLLKPIDKRVPNRRRRKWIYRAIKAVMITATYAVAILIPHLDLLISLIGALFSSALALIFPPIIEMATYWTTRHERSIIPKLIKNVLICAFGLGCCFFGTIVTVGQIIDAFKKTVNTTATDI